MAFATMGTDLHVVVVASGLDEHLAPTLLVFSVAQKAPVVQRLVLFEVPTLSQALSAVLGVRLAVARMVWVSSLIANSMNHLRRRWVAVTESCDLRPACPSQA